MQKSNVTRIRDLYKAADPKCILVIFADNAKLFSEKNDKIIWDDNTETVTIIHTNDNYRTAQEHPFKIEIFEYDVIQYIEAEMSGVNQIEKYLDKLGSTLVNENNKNEIVDYLNSTMPNKYPLYQ